MTDMTSGPLHKPAGRRRGTEFWVYFTLIFFVALPSASFRWGRDVIRKRTLNLRGPMARAWAEADRLTPIIFSV
ncbi:protein pufQ [Roseovarius faecimaris]|uniref:Protein pufQ n=1 Tax=Roseovarius faecimaris TaxID=2494550 RepID=A0A6I6INS7_9RHOB|nr:cytochrome PufQ [Roseovarius faecimaris]QGX97754.1 protein pufQ [Roseovarius faecimaris]